MTRGDHLETAGVTGIRLLGRPVVLLDGHERPPPRGRKTWAVLATLVLSGDRPPRSRLAELCFPNARDPRGALRWELTDLRHLLDGVGDVTGDPVTLVLPPTTSVDVWQVLDGAPGAADACLRGDLLEGLSFSSSEPLERWLGFERRRLTLACTRLVNAAAQQALTSGDEERAAQLQAELVARDPYA